MPMNEGKLANEIFQALKSEMGGGGIPEVDKYRLKMAKAIAKAVVNHLRLNLTDTNPESGGDRHL